VESDGRATVSFGLPSAYDPAYIMFDATNGPKNFPGARPADQHGGQRLRFADGTR